jgi:RNA polymerase sigma factor (sigma-70 family)
MITIPIYNKCRIVTASRLDATTAIEDLYSSHHHWLLGWLRKKLGNVSDAADLSHDTFERILSRADAASIREPKAYLTTIANRIVINHWRRLELERAYLEYLAHEGEALAVSPEEQALFMAALCEIDAILDKLNPKARSAFLLAQLDGLTYNEIALKLAVSERMVKKYMAQAMLHCLQADIQF